MPGHTSCACIPRLQQTFLFSVFYRFRWKNPTLNHLCRTVQRIKSNAEPFAWRQHQRTPPHKEGMLSSESTSKGLDSSHDSNSSDKAARRVDRYLECSSVWSLPPKSDRPMKEIHQIIAWWCSIRKTETISIRRRKSWPTPPQRPKAHEWINDCHRQISRR